MAAPYTLPAINSPLIQAVSTATPDAVAARDGNGDCAFSNVTAGAAVGDNGLGTGIYLKRVSKTSGYTAVETDYAIHCDASGAAFTVALPAAASNDGKILVIKKTDTSVNAVTIDPNSSETIDGETTLSLHFQHEAIEIQCDGSNWKLINRHRPVLTSAKSASFTVGGAGPIYLITVGAGTITVTLPPAAEMKDVPITLKRVDNGAGSVSITTNSTETVDGTDNPTGLFNGAGTQYDVLTLVSDGSNYHYLADRGPAT